MAWPVGANGALIKHVTGDETPMWACMRRFRSAFSITLVLVWVMIRNFNYEMVAARPFWANSPALSRQANRAVQCLSRDSN